MGMSFEIDLKHREEALCAVYKTLRKIYGLSEQEILALLREAEDEALQEGAV